MAMENQFKEGYINGERWAYTVLKGNPFYVGGSKRSDIEQRYIWDEGGYYGFGVGQIIDSITLTPVT